MGIIQLPNNSIKHFKENLDKIFETGNLAEGPWADKVSDMIKKISSSKYAIPVGSNGSGLVALLHIYSHYFKRKSVFIQVNTMYGVKTMIKTGGCEIAGYINCRLETLMPTLEDVKAAVNEYSGDLSEIIIMLSDIGGIINPDSEKISEFCKQKNIIYLEDCAHSLGATLNGKSSGTFGDAGVYSFYATKAVFAGEGGVVLTDNKELASLVKGYTIYDRFEQKMPIGVNIRPSEVQCLLIYSVLNEIDSIFKNKRNIAEEYIKLCKKFNVNYISQSEKGLIGNYYKFIITSPDQKVETHFNKIKTVTSPVYDYSIGIKNPVADFHICLPIWYNQSDNLTNKVCNELISQFS